MFIIIIIACGIIVAIIIFSFILLILLKTRASRKVKGANQVTRLEVGNLGTLGTIDTEAAMKEKQTNPSSLPNKDNVLDTQDEINFVGVGTGRTTNRSDLGSAQEDRPQATEKEKEAGSVLSKIKDGEDEE